jgi:hypothetical protein
MIQLILRKKGFLGIANRETLFLFQFDILDCDLIPIFFFLVQTVLLCYLRTIVTILSGTHPCSGEEESVPNGEEGRERGGKRRERLSSWLYEEETCPKRRLGQHTNKLYGRGEVGEKLHNLNVSLQWYRHVRGDTPDKKQKKSPLMRIKVNCFSMNRTKCFAHPVTQKATTPRTHSASGSNRGYSERRSRSSVTGRC